MKSFVLQLRAASARFFNDLFYTKKKRKHITQIVLLVILLTGVSVIANANGPAKNTNTCYGDPLTQPLFSIQLIKTNVSACGNGSDGTLEAIPSGGTAPYTYSWTGPNGFTSTSQTLTGLSIGYYNLTVTDATFTSSTVTGIHVAAAFAPYITNSGSSSASCASNGSIILYGNAGVQPYTYSLDGINYQAGNTFNNLAAGTYTGYVKDLRGCVSTKSITVLSTTAITVSSYVRPASNCNSDGSIELYRSGGSGPFTYSLDNVNYQPGNVFSNLAAGSVYTGWVMDAYGCKGSLSNITVTQVPQLTATVSKTNSSTCVNDGTIQIRGSGGVAPYTYSIGDVTYQASANFANLAPGSYACWVKDSKGCKASINVTMGTNPISVTSYTGPSNSCNTNGFIQLYRTGGTAPFTYSINNINYRNSNVFTNLPGGVYTGWVKDSKGCVASLSGITVVTGVGITVTATKTPTSTCINNGSIKLNATGGTAPLTYSMDNITYQPGNTFAQLGAGNYVGWVKDANGCKASVNATINLNHIVVTATVTDVNNCIVPDGTIQLSRTGGTGGFTYSIDGENYQSASLFTGVDEGTYTAFVKDSNVCIGTLSNINVNSNCNSLTANQPANNKNRAVAAGVAKINAYPNPTATAFILSLEGYTSADVSIVVTDALGRITYQAQGNAKQQYKFGNNFKAGLYNVQVTQGNDVKNLRLIKQ